MRINIEDSLFNDARFLRLCVSMGDEYRAIGVIVMAWKTAQKYWCPDRQPIPAHIFESIGHSESILTVGLAERLSCGSVRMRGSEEHFKWWFQRKDAGKLGGRPKKEVENEKAGESGRFPPVSGPKREKAGESGNNPLTLTLPLTLSLKKNTNTRDAAPVDNSTVAPVFDFESVAKKYPKPKGPSAEKRFKTQIKTQKDFDELNQAIENYLKFLALPENQWRHPKQFFETFLGTKASGFFWREFISEAVLVSNPSGTVLRAANSKADVLSAKILDAVRRFPPGSDELEKFFGTDWGLISKSGIISKARRMDMNDFSKKALAAELRERLDVTA